MYEPVAYYDTGICALPISMAALFHGRWEDILGTYELPANGIDAPYAFGCQRVRPSGTRMDFWR